MGHPSASDEWCDVRLQVAVHPLCCWFTQEWCAAVPTFATAFSRFRFAPAAPLLDFLQPELILWWPPCGLQLLSAEQRKDGQLERAKESQRGNGKGVKKSGLLEGVTPVVEAVWLDSARKRLNCVSVPLAADMLKIYFEFSIQTSLFLRFALVLREILPPPFHFFLSLLQFFNSSYFLMLIQESVWASSCVIHSTWLAREIFQEFCFSWKRLQYLTSKYVDFATERIVPLWHLFFSPQITLVVRDIRSKAILCFNSSSSGSSFSLFFE